MSKSKFRVTKKAVRAEIARRNGKENVPRAPQPILRLWMPELRELLATPAPSLAAAFADISARR